LKKTKNLDNWLLHECFTFDGQITKSTKKSLEFEYFIFEIN